MVKILVPLDALKPEFVDVPIEEYEAKSFGIKMQNNSTEEIREQLAQFLSQKCLLKS